MHFGDHRVRGVEITRQNFPVRLNCPRPEKIRMLDAEGRDPGHALLKQQRRRGKERIGRKPVHHRIAREKIDHCDKTHSLMVRHERPDKGRGMVAGQPARRIIDRLVKTVSAFVPEGFHTLHVFTRFVGHHHKGKGRGVGGNHQVVRQVPLEPEVGHAERPVLVVHSRIGAVFR